MGRKARVDSGGPAGRAGSRGGRAVKNGAARRRLTFWLAVALAVAAVSVIGALVVTKLRTDAPPGPVTAGAPESPRGTATDARGASDLDTPDAAWDPSWPPLPASGEPARPVEVVRAAYAYAARRPDVLKYMPCYCGCEQQGHRSNEDCFVKGRTAEGAPRWDPMGYT